IPTHRRLNSLSGHLGKIQTIITTTPQKPITQVGINKLQVMFTRVPRRKPPTRVRTSQQATKLLSMLRTSLKILKHTEPTLHPPPVLTQISTRLSTLREHRLQQGENLVRPIRHWRTSHLQKVFRVLRQLLNSPSPRGLAPLSVVRLVHDHRIPVTLVLIPQP